MKWNQMKKWLKVTSIAVLATVAAAAGGVTVSADGYQRWGTVADEQLELSRSRATLPQGSATVNSKAWKKINGVCYNGSGVAIEGAITWGMDVSEYQGTINWSSVKKAGIDFAIVRISYGTGYLDKKYAYNMEQAAEAGVPVGTYVYSTATTTNMALQEAKLAIEKMKGYKVSYPVVYDLEYEKMGNLSKTQVSRLSLTFCNEVSKAGYYPMVYCNTNWYDNEVDWSLLSGLDVWIARYGDKILAPSSSSYKYTIWQATDGDGGGTLNSTKGLVAGVPSQNDVDVDFGYLDYTKRIAPRTQPLSTYVPSTQPDDGVVDIKNGWIKEDGKTFYYENGVKAVGWKCIADHYYYFNNTKGLYTSKLLTSSKNNICYVDADGARVTNQWVDWNGKRYYMASNGYAVKKVHKIGSYYYYFSPTYAFMYKNKKSVNSAGTIYYFGSNGARYVNKKATLTESGKKNTYYFGSDSKACKGWKKISGKWYYFHKKTGVMYKSRTVTNSTGKKYIFNSSGVCTNR